MDPFFTEELHHIPFEINEISQKSCLLSCSPNGLVFVARSKDLAIFSTQDYSLMSSSSSQRRDKPLSLFKPNICIPLSHRVTWLSTNCSGSLLLLVYDSSVELLNIQQLSAQPPYGFLGDTLNLPIEDGPIQGLSWNPVDKHRFALVTASGAVRMFTVNPLQKPHFIPVGCLPTSTNARCLSWSPKGKQLALACFGSSSESTVASVSSNSATIVQVDHDLKVKRVIPVAALLKKQLKSFTEPQPIDILWTSSYCFLLGVEDSDKSKGMQLTFITALPKSDAKAEQLCEFTSYGNTRCHYQMHLLSNSATLSSVTWSPDAEECYILDVPATTAATDGHSTSPKLVTSLPLPTDSFPIAMEIGAVVGLPEPTLLIVGLLANGAVFSFKILPHQTEASRNLFSGFRMRCESADKPPQLPPVTAQSSNTTSQPADNTSNSNLANLFNQDGASETKPIVAPSSFPNVPFVIPPSTATTKSSEAFVPFSSPTNASSSMKNSTPSKSAVTGSPSMAQSISKASEQFSKALELQKETSGRAWSHLQDVFEGNSKNLQLKDDVKGTRRGVWDIEQSLKNMDSFLCVLGEITKQLQKASQMSTKDLNTSTDFLDRLSTEFDAFHHSISENHSSTTGVRLDPEAAAMLSSLRRKSRAAESFLVDLEDQMQSLSLQFESRAENTNRLRGKNKSIFPGDDLGSPLNKIQATIATNAHLIKCERSRLELISRMAGVSLIPSNDSRSPSVPVTSLGGSAVCVNREQRDAQFYRLLCAEGKSDRKTKTGKKGESKSLPVFKASSTMAEIIESMRKARVVEKSQEKEVDAVQQVKPIEKPSTQTPMKAVEPSNASRMTSQINSPGHQKNVEIASLLESAASVPSITRANSSTESYFNRPTDVVHKPATAQIAPVPSFKSEASSVTPRSIGNTAPATTAAQKPVQSGLSPALKPLIFVPSTAKSLTSPVRVNPIAAPTTKVYGAPMCDSGVDSFKPLSLSATNQGFKSVSTESDGVVSSSSVPLSTIASETAPSDTATSSRKPAILAPVSMAASTEASPDLAIPAGPLFTSINSFETTHSTPAATTKIDSTPVVTAPKPFSGGLFGLGHLTTTTSTTSVMPTMSNPFRLPFTTLTPTPTSTSVALPSGPTKSLFENTVATTQPIQLFGTAVTTVPVSTTQSFQIFGNTSVATSSSMQNFGGVTTVFTKQAESMSEVPTVTTSSGQPSQLFGSALSTFPVNQSNQAFGQPVAGPQSGGLFDRPIFTSPGQSMMPFGQSVAAESSPIGGLFSQPASSVTTPASGFFGGTATPISIAADQPSTSASPQARNLFAPSTPGVGLFGVPLTTTSGQPVSPFGQPNPAASGGLFGQPISAKPGSLFGQPLAQGGGLFGQPIVGTATSTGGLFGQSLAVATTTVTSTGGLFGEPLANSEVAAGQSSVAPAIQPGGLFGATSSNTGAGGLFGSLKLAETLFSGPVAASTADSSNNATSLQHVSNVNNLFAMSNFGLGSPSTTTSASTNVFGKLSSDAASSPLNNPNLPARNLFGAPSSVSTAANFTAEAKPGGLFGPSTLTNAGVGGLFGNQMSSPAVSSNSGGGLFSGGGGLFASPSSTTGSSPLFGGPAFGTGSATPGGLFSPNSGNVGLFGSSLTPSPPTAGAPNFGVAPSFGGMVGAPTCVAGGGLFASLGNSSSGVSFGGIANSTVQQPSTPMFGSSPSFTQRRA